MKYKIGVFGSAVDETTQAIEQAQQLGQELAKHNCIVITGACSGMPYRVASVAAAAGAEVWGFSPAKNFEGQKKLTPNDDLSIYAKMIYVSSEVEIQDELVSKKYRNVTSTASCDAGVIISGSWGTLNEFTNLVDMGKVIGLLRGTGGVADMVEDIIPRLRKKKEIRLVVQSSPALLIQKIIEQLTS